MTTLGLATQAPLAQTERVGYASVVSPEMVLTLLAARDMLEQWLRLARSPAAPPLEIEAESALTLQSAAPAGRSFPGLGLPGA